MHSLFNIASPVNRGRIESYADWLYVKSGLKRNLTTVINFYRNNPMAVQSNHFLVRLLQSITIPQSQNLERYYDNVDAISLNLSMVLKMTSSIYSGRLFDGVFYGQGNDEILLAHSEGFDPFEAHDNWENLCPVTVLRHPLSDLGLNIPNGRISGSETGLAVIAINITMLAVQYRAFRLNEMRLTEGSNDSQKSVMQFIHMYVLPNMLFTHLDHAIFNRIQNLEIGAPLGESSRLHSFFLPDYASRMNDVHDTILGNLQKYSYDFTGILRSIPMVITDTADTLMELPDMALTRQCLWGLVISRLPELTFLFRISKDGPGTMNRSEVNRIMRSMLAYKNSALMQTMLPLDVYMEINDEIKEIVTRAY